MADKPATAERDEDTGERKCSCGMCGNILTCWYCCGLCKRCCGKDEDKRGMIPYSQRKCTDLSFCLVFAIFWIGMIVIASVGLSQGQPERLLYGTDYEGNICGVDAGFEDKKQIVYPRLNEDMLYNLQQPSPNDYRFYGVCVSECPGVGSVVCNNADLARVSGTTTDPTQANLRQCIDNGTSTDPNLDCDKVGDNCWFLPMQHKSVLFRCIPLYNITNAENTRCLFPSNVQSALDPRCVLAEDDRNTNVQRPAQENQVIKQLSTAAALWSRYFADLVQVWWLVLLCGIGVSLVLSFLAIKFLQHCTGAVVWTIVFLSIVLAIVLTFVLYVKAGIINAEDVQSVADQAFSFVNRSGAVEIPEALAADAERQKLYEYAAYVMTVACVVLIVVIIAIRKDIRRSIDIITLGADAINAMPLMVLYPLLTVASLVAFLAYWVFVAASIMSAGSITTKDIAGSVTPASIAADMERLHGGATIPGFDASTVFAQFENSTTNAFQSFEGNELMKYMAIYHFFGLLWTNQFIQAIGVMVIAGATSAYYFSLDGRERDPRYGKALKAWKEANGWRGKFKGKGGEGTTNPVHSGDEAAAAAGTSDTTTLVKPKTEEELADSEPPATMEGVAVPRLRLYRKRGPAGSIEVWHALKRTLRFHMGTAAFGAFLIALVQMARAAMAYFDKQLQQLEKSAGIWVRYIKWCVNYCLWLLEQCVKFVTRNAFLYTALKGYSFCRAARAVFGLIFRKTALLAFVNVMVEVIVFLAKVAVSVICAMVTFGVLDQLPMFQAGGASEVSSAWLPAIVVLIFAYFVAMGFFSVFDIAVDAMLINYVTDMEECKADNKDVMSKEVPLHYKPPKSSSGCGLCCCCCCCGCCSGCCGSSGAAADKALAEASAKYDESEAGAGAGAGEGEGEAK